MLLLLCSLAFAVDDGQRTVYLPSAAPLTAGEGHAGVGIVGFFMLPDDRGGALAGTAEALWSPVDRLAISVNAGLGFERGLFGGLRYNVVDDPAFRLAPFVGVTGFYNTDWMFAAGLAVEGGWERVRFDASLPVLALSLEDGELYSPLDPLSGSEVGVAFVRDASVIRLGSLGRYGADVSYRILRRRAYVEAGLMVGVGAGLRLETGLRF